MNGDSASADNRSGTVFVANTRGIRRDMAWWGSRMADNFRMYGRGWSSFGLERYVRREAVPNDELPDLYRGARLGLNDHWLDMRYFGIINNRVFDSLACGLPVLTDSFPELRRVFGDALLYADSNVEFETALGYAQNHYSEISEKACRFWERNGHLYSFDARAEQILEDIELHSRQRGDGARPPKLCPEGESRVALWHAARESVLYHQNQMKVVTNFMKKRDQIIEKYRRKVAELEKSRKIRWSWILLRLLRDPIPYIKRLLRLMAGRA
jgi:hypothetical protein